MAFLDAKQRRVIAWGFPILAMITGGGWKVYSTLFVPESHGQVMQISAPGAVGQQSSTSGNNDTTKITNYNYYGYSEKDLVNLNDIDNGQVTGNSQQGAGDMTFTIKGCLYLQADTVACPIAVYNNGADRNVMIGGAGGNNFIQDQQGESSTCWKALSLDLLTQIQPYHLLQTG